MKNNNNNLTSRHGRSLVHDMCKQNKRIFFKKKNEFCFLGRGPYDYSLSLSERFPNVL
jgi:hypothetical protein